MIKRLTLLVQKQSAELESRDQDLAHKLDLLTQQIEFKNSEISKLEASIENNRSSNASSTQKISVEAHEMKLSLTNDYNNRVQRLQLENDMVH